MRIMIDITDQIARALANIAARRRTSRASIIREAHGEYVSCHHAGDLDTAFGLWGKNVDDGPAWQRKIRSEW
jgi:predicted transcriptional regulator